MALMSVEKFAEATIDNFADALKDRYSGTRWRVNVPARTVHLEFLSAAEMGVAPCIRPSVPPYVSCLTPLRMLLHKGATCDSHLSQMQPMFTLSAGMRSCHQQRSTAKRCEYPPEDLFNGRYMFPIPRHDVTSLLVFRRLRQVRRRHCRDGLHRLLINAWRQPHGSGFCAPSSQRSDGNKQEPQLTAPSSIQPSLSDGSVNVPQSSLKDSMKV